jgi:transcriptional regulator with XRE-family HTH domain
MNEFDLVNLGNRIYSARAHQKLKQQDICDKLYISQALLSKIENGRVDISISLLYQIAKTLNVSVSWLLGEKSISQLTDIERLELEKYKNFLISSRNK